MTTPREMFSASLHRCLECDMFIPSFYDYFQQSSEEVRHKFRFTDFEKQNALLAKSLKLCSNAIDGQPQAIAELTQLARRHDHEHLDIGPPLYQLWLAALIQSASEYDPQWTAKTEEAWKRVLGHVIDHMLRKY